jgi:hypothetical protein
VKVKRLQIMIDEDLDAELERQAAAQRKSKAALIRESLRKTMRPLPPLEDDPITKLIGSIDCAPVDDYEEYLYGPKADGA